jgi:hypothetical protein
MNEYNEHVDFTINPFSIKRIAIDELFCQYTYVLTPDAEQNGTVLTASRRGELI